MMKRPRDLRLRYYEWLISKIYSNDPDLPYNQLFWSLFNTQFIYTLDMDKNREVDGLNLRYQFASNVGISDNVIDIAVDHPCSMLEMMIALAIKCEYIMDDDSEGDRTSQWFWCMIQNLGLGRMTDDNFDEHIYTDIMNRFVNREYDSDGKGGLFTINTNRNIGLVDARNIDIWYQAMFFLDDYIQERETA